MDSLDGNGIEFYYDDADVVRVGHALFKREWNEQHPTLKKEGAA